MSYHHYIPLSSAKAVGDSSKDHIFSAEVKISQPTAPGMSQISSAGIVIMVQVEQPMKWDSITRR
jgi:hypothetical protein